MQVTHLSKIKEDIYERMNFFQKRNMSGVLLDNFMVLLSIVTKDIVIFSHILFPNF